MNSYKYKQERVAKCKSKPPRWSHTCWIENRKDRL